MRDLLQHFISALLLTPHWSHYLLASAPFLLGLLFLWRKRSYMRGLIDKRRNELRHFGELPRETTWAGLKKLCADISGGAKRHTRTAINVAAGLLIGAAIASPLAYRAGRQSVQSDAKETERLKWERELDAWKQRSLEYQRLFAAWKANQKGETINGPQEPDDSISRTRWTTAATARTASPTAP